MPDLVVGSADDIGPNSLLRAEWDEAVEQQGLGLGYQFDWCEVLWGIHRTEHELELLLVRDGKRLVGLVPLVKKVVWKKGVSLRWLTSLCSFHEIHGTQFIVGEQDAAVIDTIFEYLGGAGDSWDLWTMHFVKGDRQAELFEAQLRHRGLQFIVEETKRSPYMQLKGSWEEQSKELQSRFRTTVRSRERRLREKGKVTLEYLDTPGRLAAGLKAIQIVEADSWKIGAGTALTEDLKQWPFYVQYGKSAAINGTLRLPVLFLDEEPVAYDYSILHKGVYYLLKTSYRNAYRLDYPGTVLRKLVVENLCVEQVKEFDFLGLDEEWKMKWTDRVREHVVYTTFNNTLRGRYSYLMSTISRRVKSMKRNKGEIAPLSHARVES